MAQLNTVCCKRCKITLCKPGNPRTILPDEISPSIISSIIATSCRFALVTACSSLKGFISCLICCQAELIVLQTEVFNVKENPPLMMYAQKYQILLVKSQNHLDSSCHSQLCLYTKIITKVTINPLQNMLPPLNIV